MRASQLFSKPTKNIPADETANNAKLLIKAGFIHKEMAGVYAYLPLGLMVLENIKKIVKEEMNAVGGQEVMMTTLQPRDIWEKTDRWDDKKIDNWFKTKLSNGTELGVGLTHEEPIVDALSAYISSYKDLPISVYQIQNKFRNELRAKSGLLRGREFVMKDMYSFSRNQSEHEMLYNKVIDTYYKVYDRLGLGKFTYRTFADGGIFTKRLSDEFQTISNIGEDTIFINENKRIAINKEIYTDRLVKDLGFNKKDFTEKKGIEVGNTFHLESKYTDALGLYYSDKNGKKRPIIMGCYGIGISRLMGVIAEHFSDAKGLVWPESVSPFKVYLAQLGDDKSVLESCQKLYDILNQFGIGVFWDDRNARPGDKFANADLYGFPFRIVISKNTISNNIYELKPRTSDETLNVDTEQLKKVLGV